MDAILIKSRYKVTHILRVEQDYAALQAVDVESREKAEYLLNVYEGALSRQYVKSFDKLRHCAAYRGMFMADGALAAMFTYKEGEDIDSLFYKGADVAWDVRVEYAQLLFHLALSVCDYPSEVGCATFLTQNLIVLPKDRQLYVNYVVQPLGELNSRELVYLLTDQIRKVFVKRFASPNAELAFMETLGLHAFTSVPPLYSFWLEAKARIEAEYEKIYKKGSLQRGLYLVFMNLARWAKKTFKKKKR